MNVPTGHGATLHCWEVSRRLPCARRNRKWGSIANAPNAELRSGLALHDWRVTTLPAAL